MLSAAGSALVAGSTAPVHMQFIRIVRAVYVDRVVQPVGTVLEVPKHIAAGLIASGKAEATNPPEPIVEPAPPAPVAEPAKPKGKTKHAR